MAGDIYTVGPGDTIKFRKTGPFWFVDMVASANKNLVRGQTYTIATKQIFSSWICVTLKETGDLEFCLSWFDL